MSIGNKLRSKLLTVLVSEKTQNATRSITETRRKLGGKTHVVSAFLELDPLVMLSTVLATGYVYKLLGWGLIGLFVGAVVLAVAYQLMMAWIEEDADRGFGADAEAG